MSDQEFIKDAPISALKPYPDNPRLNMDAVDYVANSIRELGFRAPILVDKDWVVLAGHTRLEAAQKLGLETVPVIVYKDISPEQAKAYRLADNKTAEKAGWDFDLLDKELLELDSLFDMVDFGFDFDEDELFDDCDEEYDEDDEYYDEEMEREGEEADDFSDSVESKEEVKVKSGDIYRLGDHLLMCGDASSKEDMSTLMGDEKAMMVFTDPPYNVDIAGRNRAFNAANVGGSSGRSEEDIEGDCGLSNEELAEKLWTPAFENLRTFSEPACSIYITAPQGGPREAAMYKSVTDAGWDVRHELIWLKNEAVLSRGDYNYGHEPIFFGWNEKHRFYGEGKCKSSIWAFDKPHKSADHPTMKPVNLVREALLNSSKKGDIVIDCFGGSGTTLIACDMSGRVCRMMEKSPKYCALIIKRWEERTGRSSVLDGRR